MSPSWQQLERIVAVACQAPSAENCQPWTFRWDGSELAIDHDRHRAQKGRDRAHHDSLLALGCLLEAFDIAADVEGFEVYPSLTVEDPAAPTWATLRFPTGRTGRARHVGALERRCTDRRTFRGGSLEHPVFQAILEAPEAGSGLRLLGQPPQALQDFFQQAERFVWSHDPTWVDVMRWLRVSQREVEVTADGASWRTLGWDLPELKILRFVRHPWARRILAKTPAPRWMGAWWRRQLRSSAALVLVTVKTPGREALVGAGRSMMRAWLLLTEAEYGVQPHSQQAFFVHEAAVGTLPADVGSTWRERYARGLNLLQQSFDLDPGELPVMLLRTGVSSTLPGHRRALRRPVHEVLRQQ